MIKILKSYEKILENEDQEITNKILRDIVIKLIKITKQNIIEKQQIEEMYS